MSACGVIAAAVSLLAGHVWLALATFAGATACVGVMIALFMRQP